LSGETKASTDWLKIAGRWWRYRLEGDRLVLTAGKPVLARMRIEGGTPPFELRGWSGATGWIHAELDPEGSFEVPEGVFRLHGYKRGFRGTRWTVDATGGGIPLQPRKGRVVTVLRVDGKARCTLHKDEAKGHFLFQLRCRGASGEGLDITRGRFQVHPVLIVQDRDGKPVFQKAMDGSG
ncbi:MAG: hypothetical protein ACYTHN_13140, partial [Planctomycetota bacterium]